MNGPMGRKPMGKPQVKIENPGKLMKQLLSYIFKSYKVHLFIVIICIFISVLANVQGTLFMKTLIDEYIIPLLKSSSRDFGPLARAILRVACFYAVGVAAAFSYNKIMVYVTQGTLRNLRNDMFARMENLPVKYFDTHAHGDIMSIYTNDIDTLRQMISQSFPQLLSSGITIVSVLVSMIILNIPLTVLTVVMVGVMLFFSRRLAGLSGRYFLEQQQNIGTLNGYIEEMMEGQKVVKVFCHEQESMDKFNELNEKLFNSANNANKFANVLMPTVAQLGNISYVLCSIAGGILAINGFGGFTLGGLASFLAFNKSFNMPINQVSQQLNSIVMALAGAKRIFDLLNEEPETDQGYVTLVNAKEENKKLTETDERTGRWAWKHYHQATGTTDYVELKGDMVLDGVDFGYSPDKIVLHDIRMYAKPGQKIAFVGSTGAGKTTITNLLNRFYDIQDGKIRYDGININKIKKADLRRSMGIVLQDTSLFTGTVMENIRYGRLDAT
ncbi:MAG: ABC transporter ATP-binding protein, partial [Clostridia bacterium]|nr:ABC transporter ATP-binding protein [Clostridia bacterium]MDY5555000.1 ABC transporter ATP-binding protein [Blautia sp.]